MGVINVNGKPQVTGYKPTAGPAQGGPYYNNNGTTDNNNVANNEGNPTDAAIRYAQQNQNNKKENSDFLSYAYKPIPSQFKVLQDTAFLKDNNGKVTQSQANGVVASTAIHSAYQVFSYHLNSDPSKFRETSNNSFGKDANSIDPTYENLIDKWQQTPTKQPYAWSDFLYCKYYDLIPNNSLVTVRRYPFPVIDNPSNIKDPKNPDSVFPPIAQAVTWFGEETGNKLSDIMNMNTELAWRNIESKINTVEGNEKGGQGSLMQFLTGGKNATQQGYTQDQINLQKQNADNAEPFSNKLYGKLNVVKDVQVRDRGLIFKQDFELKFTYSLKYHDHINPKIAMIDCIANILSLCYNSGTFWGGNNRYFPNVERTAFFGDQSALYSGQYGKYFESAKKEFSNITSGAGNFFKDLMSNPLDALAKLGGEAATFALGNVLADSRPKLVGFPALMTGAPTGEWHVVVGNPFNPILTIGNLICKSCSFKFSDQIGHDDFPDELTVTIKLEHARSRDKGDIESMFNVGKGRVYYSLATDPDPTDPSSKNNPSVRYFNSNSDIVSTATKVPATLQNVSNTFYKALTNI